MRSKNLIQTSLAALLGAALGLGGGIAVAQTGGAPGSQAQQPQPQQQPPQQPMQPQQQPPQQQQGYQPGAAADADKSRQVQGRIQALKSVQLRGMNQPNLVALIETRKGDRRLVVDLGPQNNLRKLKLRPGSRIAAQGKVAQVKDQLVLVANRARIRGQQIDIQRPLQQRQFVDRLRAMSPEQRQQLGQQMQAGVLGSPCPQGEGGPTDT